jgi:hypothetical protein
LLQLAASNAVDPATGGEVFEVIAIPHTGAGGKLRQWTSIGAAAPVPLALVAATV